MPALLRCLLLFLLLVPALPAAAAEAVAAVARRPAAAWERGLLWQVERPGRPPSWLYGTMHVDDERVLALAPPVRKAFAAARGFAVEMIEDAEAIAFYRRAMVTPEPRLAAVLGADDFARVAGLLAGRGLPPQAIGRFKPWAALLVLLQPPGPSGIILDRVLLDDARQAGKTITALENIDEQVEVFDAMPEPAQLALLRYAAARQDELAEAQRALTAAYLRRELGSMWRLNAAVMGDDPALAEPNAVFLERLLFERNRRFAERLEPLLRGGGVFAAFGALHLYGPDGVPALLAARGWRVRALY